MKTYQRTIPLLLLSISTSVCAQTWLDQALQLQRQIDEKAPLKEATFLGTHNSYNSKAYQITPVRYVDPNQTLSIADQLKAGVRSIELDTHWTYNKKLEKEILLCHGKPNHVGCSVFDRPVEEALQEILNWVKSNPNELILLYIERHLDGHELKMAELLNAYLGKYIFKSEQIKTLNDKNTCTALPGTLTKAEILKSGKQILVVTKECEATNSLWNNIVFSGTGQITSLPYTFLDFTITTFKPAPDCSRSNLFYSDPDHTSLWRIYEDRTVFGKVVENEKPITDEKMKQLNICGINWQALDMLTFNDTRLRASIWSWAENYPQPGRGECALYAANIGILNVDCGTYLQGFVCQEDQTRAFKISYNGGNWDDGSRICRHLGKHWKFATPINGAQMEFLKKELEDNPIGVSYVWLNYATNAEGRWEVNLHHANV